MSDSMKNILIPTLLAPPARLYALFMQAENIVIDTNETWPKQTLRNRYLIGSPNDVRALVVPVHKPSGHRTRTNEIEIDYSENWPLYHKKSLTTAYSKSPFFLYYADYIFAEFERRHVLLIDLNAALQGLFIKWLSVKTPFQKSPDFIRTFDGFDARPLLKNSTAWDLHHSYYQPFDEVYGFRNSLSVLDILFNLGPEAVEFLQKESAYASL